MGNTFKTGNYVNGIFQDASNNIGIGGSPSGSYKFEVTGTGRFTGALTAASATFSSADLATDGLGNVNIFTTDAAATGKGGSLAFGGGTTGGTSPYAFAKIEGIYDGSAAYNGAMLFSTNNGGTIAERMRITSSGNVGIGTSSPTYRLDVLASGATMASIATSSASGGFLRIGYNTSSTNGYIGAGNQLVSGGGVADMAVTSDAGAILFATSSGTERMRITSGGDVGIGNANAVEHRLLVAGRDASSSYYALVVTNNSLSSLLYIRNDGYAWISQNAWAYGSDRRLKENINYIESGLDKILALKPAKFDYIDGIKNNIGWIAQDVEEVIPEAVLVNTNDEREYLSLKSDFIIPYLVKAVQELSAKVSALENKS